MSNHEQISAFAGSVMTLKYMNLWVSIESKVTPCSLKMFFRGSLFYSLKSGDNVTMVQQQWQDTSLELQQGCHRKNQKPYIPQTLSYSILLHVL